MKQQRKVEKIEYEEHTIPGTEVVMMKRVTPHKMTPLKKPYIFDPEQVEDVAIGMKLGLNIMLTGPTGCISGDAMIGINRGGKGAQVRLDHLVRMHNGGKAGGRQWDVNIPTMVRARLDDGTIRLVPLVDAFESGAKRIYEVVFATGHRVRSTSDHRYLTASGWVPLARITIGDFAYVENTRTPAKRSARKKLRYKLRVATYHPYAGRKGTKPGKGGFTVPLHRLTMEAAISGVSVDTLVRCCKHSSRVVVGSGFIFLDPKKWAVHHVDEDPKNNDLDNLSLMTPQAHRRHHAGLALENIAVRAELSEIISISEVGVDKVYDLSMGEPHNFLANGVVVHNCGKTSLPRAVCAELGLPLVRFNCDGETRVSNLRGMNMPSAENGVLTLKFSPGDLATCMMNGWPVLLDEIDAALPSVRFVLQPVLEEGQRSLRIPETGETIVAAEGFQVFATGNTIGYRAITRAHYAGTSPINAAFLDRFGMVISCGYPDRNVEKQRILANVPQLADGLAEGIARAASTVREEDKFTSDFSTRRCVQWAQLMVAYGGHKNGAILRSAQLAVLRKLESATDAKVAKEIICRTFGYEEEAL